MKVNSGYNLQTMEDHGARGAEGSLPASWQILKIADVAEINPSRPPELRQLLDDFRVTFVPMRSVSEHAGAIVEPIEKSFGEVKKGFTYFAEGDVIFAKITPCMQNGKAAIARELMNGLGFGSTEFHVLHAKGKVLSEWLYYFVRQKSFRDEAQENFRGSAGQQRVPAEFLANHKIPLPPLSEQRRIVERIQECLSRIDEIKRLREETKQEVEEAFSSLLAEFFDPAWPCKTLGSLVTDIRNGWSGRERKDGSIAKMLRLSAVHSRTIDPTESKDILLDTTDIEAFRVVKDDVFVVRGNGSKHLVGRSAIAGSAYDNVVFNDLLIRLRFVPDILPRFANYALHSPALRRQIEERAKTAAGIWKINQTHLSELLTPCPDPSDQLTAIERIERATNVCEQLANNLAEVNIDSLSQAVLRKAFAGEL